MPVEDFIIYVYCCVTDIYPELCKSPIRSRGFQPKLTDSEVITMDLSFILIFVFTLNFFDDLNSLHALRVDNI